MGLTVVRSAQLQYGLLPYRRHGRLREFDTYLGSLTFEVSTWSYSSKVGSDDWKMSQEKDSCWDKFDFGTGTVEASVVMGRMLAFNPGPVICTVGTRVCMYEPQAGFLLFLKIPKHKPSFGGVGRP